MGYRLPPTLSRRIGFEVSAPGDFELDGETVRCRQPEGELEISIFKAALVIDRDGILEEKVRHAIVDHVAEGALVLEPMPVALEGASGWRVDAEYRRGPTRPALPYIFVFALAPDDLGVDAGVLVTVRSASPQWPAADAIVRSLKILARRSPTANDPR
jgi:hypothetical protein